MKCYAYLSNEIVNGFQDVDWAKKLKFLSLHRPTFSSFDVFPKMKSLRVLEVDYAKNLNDFSALQPCENMSVLDIQNCPSLTSSDFAPFLNELIFLRIWNCKNLESLSGLRGSHLDCLDVYSSKVKDGDFSFLDEYKTLKYLRFSDMKHNNRKLKDVLSKKSIDIAWPHIWNEYKESYI